jgi:hypothetical protein
MENNTFLRNFMKMRQNLHDAPNKVKADIKSLPKPTKETSIEELIQDKPKPKVVEEYFKKRTNELFVD